MNSWTLWSEQQPTDASLVYRWRIPAQEILGLVMQPEWSDKIFSPYANLIFIVRVVRNGTGGNGIYPKD